MGLQPVSELETRLKGIVSRSAWFMAALAAARDLELPVWCIGAGALRNVVWDTLHDLAEPSSLSDIDLAWFDASDLSRQRDLELQSRLTPQSIAPWEVTNQAGVHLWFESYFGYAVAPLRSLDQAVASWPEYATSVGVWLDKNDGLHVIAPHGLGDLFDLVVRRNPTRIDVATYRRRVAQKSYTARWPQIRIVEE